MFRDFIPDNDPEAGTVGASGFQDYVPEKKPIFHPEPVIPVQPQVSEPVKKKLGRPPINKGI